MAQENRGMLRGGRAAPHVRQMSHLERSLGFRWLMIYLYVCRDIPLVAGLVVDSC
jgi:hypothetical protein